MGSVDRGIEALMSQPGSGCCIESGRVASGIAGPRFVCAPSLADSVDK